MAWPRVGELSLKTELGYIEMSRMSCEVTWISPVGNRVMGDF